jgi:predicted 3-demethylubiquinone-9 3-methyltransferase (glyoxalase superfamily)
VGEKGPCDRLKDRFGVSWRVVPSVLIELLEAMLQITRIDIAKPWQAYAR